MDKTIKIPGELESVAIEGIVADSKAIIDRKRNKRQEEINDDVDAKIVNQDNKIDALEKQDVVLVDTLPAVADADPKKIYRVVGTDSYTDHMLNAAGDDFKILATYSFPGIDDDPTPESDNLVKSGGVDRAIKEVAFSGFFVGKGENISDSTSCVKAIKGHTYAVYPVLSSWDFGTTTNDKVVFGVSCIDSNEQRIALDSVIYQYRNRLSGKLQVTIPDTIEANGSLLVYGRAAVGTKVWFEIVDITDVLAGDAALERRIAGMDRKFSVISFVGKGSTLSKSSTYCGVVAGRTYRIVMLDMSFAESEYSGIRQGVYYTDNNDAEKTIIEYSIQWVRQVFDITIPDDFKADGSLIFGGRADAGVEVTAYVYDITDILAESNRAAEVEQALDIANKRKDLFLFGDNVEEINGYISYTNGPHKVSNANSHYYLVPVKAGDKITANANTYAWCIFASRTVNGNTETYTYATGYSTNMKIKPNEVVIPADGTWFYITKDYNSASYGVTEILVNGVDVLGGGIIAQAANIAKIDDIDSKVNNTDVEINGEEWKNKEYIGYYNGTRWGGIYGQYKFKVIPINPGDTIDFRSSSSRTNILSDFNGVGGAIALSTQTAGAEWNHTGNFVGTAGSDAKYLMFYTLFSGSERLPTNIFINDIDVYKDTHLKAKVEDLNARVATIEGDGSIVALNGGETHMKLIMDNLVRKQGTPSSFTGNRPFVLLYFSDIHGKLNGTTEIKDELAISRIVDFKNKFSSYISDTLHGGDGVYTSMAGESTLDYDGAEGILNTIGNHDVFISGNNFADAQTAYDKFFAGKIENWGVEYTEGLCYYYKDYAVSKLRLIILDCMHWDSAQNAWLAATLADAAENGISVVICDHYVPNARFTILREECTFSTLDPGNIASGGSLNAQASATVQAVMDDNTHPLDFVCWLFGHTHRDYFGYLTDYPNQYGICIAKASGDHSGWEQDSVRTKGTKAYDCLNLISIDTTAKVLSVTRLGNNTDRFMRQKNYLTFDYKNHKIVGNS